MKGCQLAGFTNWSPATTNTMSTPVFTMTMKLLKRADSRIPITRIAVMARMTHTAGTFTSAPVACHPALVHPTTACLTWAAVQNRKGGPMRDAGR